MKNKTGLLILMLLILTNSSIAQQSNGHAPEATAAETTLSFRDIPELKAAFIDAKPRDRKDGIPVGELGVDAGNKAMILKLAQEIANGKHGAFDSFLIAHKGKLLFESYYSHGRINLPHFQASATKVYTGLAIGRAIQLGYLTMIDLDKPLVSFLKDLDPAKFVEGAEKITLHKAMTMRGGLRISDDKWKELNENPAALKGQGLVQALLEHSAPISLESQNFSYGNFNPELVMQVIEAIVPGTAKDFIKNELLDKMGITNYHWQTVVSGLPSPGSRSNMTSRDMIKWGTLASNKGKWNGEQLIPEAFISKAIHRIVRHSEDENFSDHGDISNTGYGYFWWQSDMKVGNTNYFSTSARGGGGQYIILIDALDLMIVVTAYDRDDHTLQLTAERILPAFIQNSNPTIDGKSESQDSFPVLEDRYLSQKPPGLTPEVFAPGIVSTEKYHETVVTFLPNMKELSFTRYGGKYKKPTLFVMQYKNHKWSRKSILSADRTKYEERFNPGLSEMKRHERFKDIPITGFTVSAKGTYYFYFIDFERDGLGHMSYSRLINGKYETPQKMSKAINRGKYIAHPYIAPDESYLMWDAEKEDENTPDIYISFRQKDGSWGTAINMGDEINTAAYEQRPRVTPDGKYLFFWRGDKKVRADGSTYWVGNPHWVDAQIIENLRPKQ